MHDAYNMHTLHLGMQLRIQNKRSAVCNYSRKLGKIEIANNAGAQL